VKKARNIRIFAATAVALIASLSLNTFSLNAAKLTMGGYEISKDEHKATIYFKVNLTAYDPAFHSNGQTMSELQEWIRAIQANPDATITHVTVSSAASPEGPEGYNDGLSIARGRTLINEVRRYMDLPESMVTVKSAGPDWDKAIEVVEASQMEYRDEVLRIMREEPIWKTVNGQRVPWRRPMLIQLHGGKPWRYMIVNYFPDIRRSEIIVEYKIETLLPDELTMDDMVLDFQDEEIDIEDWKLTDDLIDLMPMKWHRLIFAVKTNAIYDAIAAFNVEVEVPIGKKFSVMWEDVFPWYHWGPNGNKYCYQYWEMGIEGRYWLNFRRPDTSEPLQGFFVGPYAMSAKYDFQRDTWGCYQGEHWSVGVSAGWARAFKGKLGRFNFELSASVGYLQSDYRHYNPSVWDDYQHLYRDRPKTGVYRWFGPTKIKASLVLPIYWGYHQNSNGYWRTGPEIGRNKEWR